MPWPRRMEPASASGPEAFEHHGHGRGTRQGSGFRSGQAAGTDGLSADARTARRATADRGGGCVGTPPTCRLSRRRASKLDGRSDIFSFGSVLYEMVTGRRPFTGDSRLSILTKILNEDPTPPSQLAASIPPELEKIILRCLRKDPARRYQTMADLKVALEDVEAESALGRSQCGTAPSRRRWAWAALLPVLL